MFAQSWKQINQTNKGTHIEGIKHILFIVLQKTHVMTSSYEFFHIRLSSHCSNWNGIGWIHHTTKLFSSFIHIFSNWIANTQIIFISKMEKKFLLWETAIEIIKRKKNSFWWKWIFLSALYKWLHCSRHKPHN